ncbi:uncharacterized protein N7477_002548 [Penicillium maclennaniae]|uniref:uncharacterized protein n=1 Tax=Penicillium maclennaniae TaxID=1343394 RepID=UPI0025410C1A|nr:uncharacterized protein N7477_002548 [Penicillium maclennaniae]KAJ5676915.1 hypothetical protein N7477_002548 [Penicillium maclennaniae]
MKREHLPLGSLPAWLKLNGIDANGVAFQQLGSNESGADRGNALVAMEKISSDGSDTSPVVLLRVPSELVLSLETVHDYSESDHHLRDVLEAVGDFGRTPRGAIMIFLLVQLTHSCPEMPQHIGVSGPWTEYIKFLPPCFPLPTFYSAEEQELLRGTSLGDAVAAKESSLEREFEHLRHSTEHIDWCQLCWWNEGTGKMTLDDLKYADAAYRSRMVDLPGSGHAMVPCVDMANHASGEEVNALYEADSDGNALLQLRWGKSLQPGDEATISYGDEKPASEMIFSYGFLDDSQTEAKQVTFDMTPPSDDPLAIAKKMICRETPGIRVAMTHDTNENSRQTVWDSPLVWWACVNEEDGLEIRVTQTTEGTRELETIWKGEKIRAPTQLRDLLANDPAWEIFRLRAVVLVLERLEAQVSILQETEEVLNNLRENEKLFHNLFRPDIFALIERLRRLEAVLLARAVNDLGKQREELIASESVTAYLAQQSQAEEVEDFS